LNHIVELQTCLQGAIDLIGIGAAAQDFNAVPRPEWIYRQHGKPATSDSHFLQSGNPSGNSTFYVRNLMSASTSWSMTTAISSGAENVKFLVFDFSHRANHQESITIVNDIHSQYKWEIHGY